MHITFIRPNLYDRRSRDAMEPLVFAILKSLTPPDVEVAFHDERLAPIPFDEATDLVAMTVETFTARRAYQIANEFRARGVPVVMGGYHPTFLPDEALQFADAVVIGDAEGVWPRVVEDARKGRLQQRYSHDGFAPLHGMKPDRGIFHGKRYAPVSMIQYGRGCRYNCEFCSIRAFYGSNLRQRPVAEVIAEIERAGRRHIFIVDDNIFVDVPKAKELFTALIPLKIRWSCQVSIDVARDPELMRLLEKSGCTTAVVGFESLDPRNIKGMRKAPNLKKGNAWDNYSARCQILRNHHLQTWAAFTLGHDHDTVESIKMTHEFAMENKFCFAAYNILMPYPNTPFYTRLQREGRLLWDGKWWLHPEYRFNHAAFVPKNMTPDELTEACWYCRSHWNTPSAIFQRMWDWKTHLSSLYRLGVFLKYNPIYGRETFRKQGMLFGLSRTSVDTRTPGPLAAGDSLRVLES